MYSFNNKPNKIKLSVITTLYNVAKIILVEYVNCVVFNCAGSIFTIEIFVKILNMTNVSGSKNLRNNKQRNQIIHLLHGFILSTVHLIAY